MPVYFDLGLCGDDGKPTLWRHNPKSGNGRAFLTPVSREFFLKVHREGLNFEEDLAEVAREYVQSF
jgi:competence protein CoiA